MIFEKKSKMSVKFYCVLSLKIYTKIQKTQKIIKTKEGP